MLWRRRQWHPTPVLLPGKSHGRRSLVGCSPWEESRTRLSDFTFTFHFHALEKEMATHSSVLAWRIPGMGESGGLPSMGLHRVGHDWTDLAAAAAARMLWRTRAGISRPKRWKRAAVGADRWGLGSWCPKSFFWWVRGTEKLIAANLWAASKTGIWKPWKLQGGIKEPSTSSNRWRRLNVYRFSCM